ncbi:MAG: hypothetical protein IJ748_02735 [Bacteroidales bacterium]|nr:hypothetical protein [Bacteroidales bacterium]
MIKYHNAKDIDGKIVPIGDAQSGTVYYCIGCGKEMIAKKGKIKEHHFSHKQTFDCNAETYLHRYAKQYIKDLFDSQEHFYVQYDGLSECGTIDTCTYKDVSDCSCIGYIKLRFDLKEFYDTCELESEYNGYVADILLCNSSKPNREPCFIEIAVTHSCEQEKLDSGMRIIEIHIPKHTDDLSALYSIEETSKYDYWREAHVQIQIDFHNFKKHNRAKHCSNQNPVTVFFINRNGKGQVRLHEHSCMSYGVAHIEDSSLFEIHFPYNNLFSAYREGLAIASLRGKKVINCWLCKHHWYSETWLEHKCNNNKPIKSPSDAMNCPDYLHSSRKAQRLCDNIGAYQVLEPNADDDTLS